MRIWTSPSFTTEAWVVWAKCEGDKGFCAVGIYIHKLDADPVADQWRKKSCEVHISRHELSMAPEIVQSRKKIELNRK